MVLKAGGLFRAVRLLVGYLVVLAALAPAASQVSAQANPPPTRLDWGTRAPIPVGRADLGLAAAPNGKLYAVGGRTRPSGGLQLLVDEYDPSTNTWRARRPFSIARFDLAVAVAQNGKLYAMGGAQDSGERSNGVEVYDPEANTWTTLTTPFVARDSLGLAAGLNGKLYAMGGRLTGGGITDLVQEYDPATNVWMTRSVMPFGRSSFGITTAPNGKIYVAGGQVSNDTDTARVDVYDPVSNTWDTTLPSLSLARDNLGLEARSDGRLYAIGGHLRTGSSASCATANFCALVEEYVPGASSWTPKADLPTARTDLGVATAANGRIYAIGGDQFQTPTSDGFKAVEEYDPFADRWSVARSIDIAPYQPRYAPAVTTANNKMYVFGGADTNGIPTDSAFEYDPATGVWRALNHMNVARHSAGAAAVTVNGVLKIFVIGGYNGGFLTAVEELDLAGAGGMGTWRGAGPIAQLSTGRSSHGVAAGPNGRIYVVGGGQAGGSVLKSTMEYDPVSNTWATINDMGTPRDTLGVAVLKVGNETRIYAIGGENFAGGATSASGSLAPVANVEYLVTLPSGGGSWTTAAPLPAARSLVSAVAASNGKLYAIGGSSTAASAPQASDSVFEFDPGSTTPWSTLDGVNRYVVGALPTPRYGVGTAAIGAQIFAVGGSQSVVLDGKATPGAFAATISGVPSVSIDGTYVVRQGQTITLSANGTDPEDGALSYAWDLNGDLLYETSGRQVTFSAAGLPLGARTVRVRALDPQGAYAITATTVTVTDPPSACSPRPNVQVQTVNLGSGQIRTTLTPGQGSFSGVLRLGQPGRPLVNASVNVDGGPSGVTSAQDVPIGGSQVVLTVTRQGAGVVAVPLSVTDACGEWKSFVGFGPGV